MINYLVELIWPSLQGDPPKYDNFLSENTKTSDDCVDITIDLALYMLDQQKERISKIESKSAVFLGFFGTVIAILAFATKDIIIEESHSFLDLTIITIGGVLVLYILQIMR